MASSRPQSIASHIDQDPAVIAFTQLKTALANHDATELDQVLRTAHGSAAAKALTLLTSEQRDALVRLAGATLHPAILIELDETIRNKIITQLSDDHVAQVLQDMESDEATLLLETLPDDVQKRHLRHIPKAERIALRRALKFPEDSAGRLMQTDIVTQRSYQSVGQVIDYFRDAQHLPDGFLEIYATDRKGKPVGVVRLDELLRRPRARRLRDFMDKNLTLIPAMMDKEDVATLFRDYNLLAAPVVNGRGELLGVITSDDVLDVIYEEAGEDILRLGGVQGEAKFGDTILQASRERFTWLLVNLATAVLASFVISLFDATLKHMVALAILMPIIASMGGNAGTQTLTVAVRAIATKDLLSVNALRAIRREIGIGLLNGVGLAAITGLVGGLWFGNVLLGWVLVGAMIVNMFAAALAGILIPLWLNRAGLDPAISSSVFVTTVTDVVGFVAFLGLASLYLM